MRTAVALMLGITCIASFAGCGRGDGKVKVFRSEGTLTMDGESFGPTTLHLIALEKGRRSAVGVVDEKGKVTFTTYETGDGLPSGAYRVAVGVDLATPPRPFPKVYRDFQSSPLQVNVDSLDGNDLKMVMDSKAGPLVKTSRMEERMNAAGQSESFKAGIE